LCELLFTNKKVINADVDLPRFKIRRDFGLLQTLTANISVADRHTNPYTCIHLSIIRKLTYIFLNNHAAKCFAKLFETRNLKQWQTTMLKRGRAGVVLSSVQALY